MVINSADREIALKTGELYASIWDRFDDAQWSQFSDDHFYKWSPLPMENQEFIKGKVCLDAGCGSGRAVRSMLLAGATRVCGIDMGAGCVRNTEDRNKDQSDRLEVKHASVLEIPYPDETFDFVHCDGVLHHTTDPARGFSELVRVLRPGGQIVIAVYGRGGLMNFAIYSARMFRNIIPQGFTLGLMKIVTSDPVMLYAVMDCMYVPIRKNYYACEIREWFDNSVFTDIMRMDSVWGPYAYGRWMKGEGYIKFRATKLGN